MYFIIIKELNRRQIKWSKEFEQYKFTIRYTSNKNNDRANALNRQQNYKKKKPNTAFLKSTTTNLFQLMWRNWMQRYKYSKTRTSNFQWLKNDSTYQKTESMKLSKNITTNHCRTISIYSKQCNFYDDTAGSTTCDRRSRHILKNALIVRKTNTVFIKNTKKFNIRYRRTDFETKWRWILLQNYRFRWIQQQKKITTRY